MRRAIVLLAAIAAQTGWAQEADRDFSGVWRLNAARSQIRGRADIPAGFLRVTQNASVMAVSASEQEGAASTDVVYALADKPERSQAAGLTFNIATKWEGRALLASVIVGGRADYVLAERWVKSRDGGRLTITRTIEGRGSEVESTLEYDSARSTAPPQISQRDSAPAEYVLEPGTRILLRLRNPVSTKHSVAGDRIYLETAVPVFLRGRLVVPEGSSVSGTIIESQRAGRVKGRSELNFRFDSLTLPNGTTRDFRSRAGSVDAQGDLDRNEGRITGEGSKGKDAGTVAKTTGAGTGIGSIAGAAAGHAGTGLGIGAAAGAVAGLAGVLSSRGKDVVIPRGTTMEMVLDREIRFAESEVYGRIQ